MKNKNLFVWVLVGILLPNLGCTVLKSSELQKVDPGKGYLNKMVYCLPKGMIRIQRKPADKDKVEVTIQAVYVPDPKNYYTLQYCPNLTYEENITISLTNEMLLKKIDITSKPKVGEIVMKVFELAREIAKLTLPLPSAKGPEAPKERYFDVMIDPEILLKNHYSDSIKGLTAKRQDLSDFYDELKKEKERGKEKDDKIINDIKEKIKKKEDEINKQVQLIDNYLKNDNYESLGTICNLCQIEDIKLTPLFSNIAKDVPSPEGGIKYRPLLPYRLEIQFPDNFFVQNVYLPNEAPIFALDITRPAFADRVTSLTFENGVLTQADLTRPSEALAFMKIPVDLVKAIAGLPLDLLQFRVQNIQQSNALLQAQIDEIKNKQLLMDLQKGKTQ